jgi:predicted DNA-binding transcriptional regulator AlpA
MSDKRQRPASQTYTMIELSGLLGLSRNSTYLAAAKGELPFPVIRVGKRLIAPKRPVDQMLGINGDGARKHRCSVQYKFT